MGIKSRPVRLPQPSAQDLVAVRDLNRNLTAIWKRANDLGWDVSHLAGIAGMGRQSVHNLVNGVTMFVRWNTVAKLANAVGIVLVNSPQDAIPAPGFTDDKSELKPGKRRRRRP